MLHLQTDTTPSHGNALQACVASLLGLEMEAVPNFVAAPEGYWEAMLAHKVQASYVDLLSRLYQDQRANVQCDCKSRDFSICKGTKQGDLINDERPSNPNPNAAFPQEQKYVRGRIDRYVLSFAQDSFHHRRPMAMQRGPPQNF